MTVRMARNLFWENMENQHSDSLIVYLYYSPYFVIQNKDTMEYTSYISILETELIQFPQLLMYTQIGLYSFMGLASISINDALAWVKAWLSERQNNNKQPICIACRRCGADGLKAAIELELGANEESELHSNILVYLWDDEASRVKGLLTV